MVMNYCLDVWCFIHNNTVSSASFDSLHGVKRLYLLARPVVSSHLCDDLRQTNYFL